MKSKMIPVGFVLLVLTLPAAAQRNRPTARPKPTPSGPPTATIETSNDVEKEQWIQIYGARVFMLHKDESDPTIIYATTPLGLYKTIDKGFRWNLVFRPPFPDPRTLIEYDHIDYYPGASNVVFAQSKSAPNVMLVGANWFGDTWPTLWKTEDGGKNWHETSSGVIPHGDVQQKFISQIQISPADPSTIYVVFYYGPTFKSLNGGKSWGTIEGQRRLSLNPTNPDNLVRLGAESSDGGLTWSKRGGYPVIKATGFSFDEVTFHPTNPKILFGRTGGDAVNSSGGYWISEDAGNTWRDLAIPGSVSSLGFAAKADESLFAATDAGIYFSSNVGRSWRRIFDKAAWSIVVVDSQTIYSNNGTGIWKTSNGGSTWHRANLTLPMPITHASYNADVFDRLCAADDATNTIYVCAHGGFWTTQDSGFNWVWNTIGNDSADVRRIFLVSKTVFAVTWENNGPFGGTGISLLRIDSTGVKTVNPANRSAFESFIGISESDAKTFYFGNVVTDDGGFSWREIGLNNDLRQAQIVVSPASSKVAYILAQGDAGGVFATTDGGTTWTRHLERTVVPGIFVADPKEPLTVYTIILNHLYRSRNGGNHWDDLVYLAPLGDFRVTGQLAVNPMDSNVLYLLSSTGLWTSRNAGRSWRLADNPLQGGDNIQKIHVAGNMVLGQGRYGIYRLSDGNLGWAVDKWKVDEAVQGLRQGSTANESDTPITTSTSIATEIASSPASLDELVALIKKLIDAGLKGDRNLIDSYLAEDYVWRDVGNRKTMDRAKFLSRVKRDNSIRNYSCGDYKMSSEGALTSLTYVCEYDLSSIVLANHVRQRFTDRFIRVDGAWKLTSEDTIVLPNNR